MRLITGLGNPGRKYRETPHNVGFEVLDLLAFRGGLDFRASRKFAGLIAEGTVAGVPVYLLKPTTYMNLSGEAVSIFLRYHPLDLSDLLVITDDINLPMGRLRLRERGSHGGHKGLLSIIQMLGTEEFSRLRVGVHPSGFVDDFVRFVLTPPAPDEREIMGEMKTVAADAVEHFLSHGFEATANLYNRAGRFDEKNS